MNEIIVKLPCVQCHGMVSISVNEKDYSEWLMGTTRHVQHVFPYLTAGEREMFITGICDKCLQAIFDNDEEEA